MQAKKMKQTEFEAKFAIFNDAVDAVRALIRDDHGVCHAISMVADHHAKSGIWDRDDLITELNYMGFCEVDSYND